MRRIILTDNGSRRPAAVLNLHRLARELSKKSGLSIDAVPLQHAHKIPPEAFGGALGGHPVITFPGYIRTSLRQGVDEFFIIPLFFGRSRAISSFIPDTFKALQTADGTPKWSVADVLCPLPRGEPMLARLLYGNLSDLPGAPLAELDYIVLVDHGSPSREVTRVREKLASQLLMHLPGGLTLLQAAMERREGREYDFCGPLLNDLLEQLARESKHVNVAISMLFISPGRHAGQGGDIAEICDKVIQRYPGLKVHISPLVGDHPLLIDLLFERVQSIL